MDYKDDFNLSSDRRQLDLPFVGEDRRLFFKEKFRRETEELRLKAFLSGLHMIPHLRRVAKNVNGNV